MKTITATGTKGFLLWLKDADPTLYAKVNKGVIQTQKNLNAGSVANLGRLGCPPRRALGDITDDTSFDFSFDPSTVSQPDLNLASGGTDSATMANSTNMTNAIAATITGIANGYSNIVLTQAQMNQQNALLQTNLQRAQQGLPPLALGPNGQIQSTGISPIILLGFGVLAVLMLTGGKKKDL